MTSAQEKYPAAHAKLAEADALLWSDFGDRSLSTIGHLCREAMQLFAAALTREIEVSVVESDPARTKNRIMAVVDRVSGQLGTRERDLLLASIDYWSAVNGIVQRQEHGSQASERALDWVDARRVVFHTAIVMLEIAYSIDRVPLGRA
jgi:hypothetical protein